MKIPVIINIDSQYDWTREVRDIWRGIDWNGLKTIVPLVSKESWDERRSELVLIGLCSSLLIEDAYSWNMQDDNNRTPSENDRYLNNEWKDRQTRSCERLNSNEQRQKFRNFTSEEPHFRSSKVGKRGIIECYGIYVENWKTNLRGRVNSVIKDKGVDLPEGPAIFLCPERVNDIYSTLMTLGEEFRNPLPLSSNPVLVNLNLVLLHELGHHFLPVHRTGTGRYASEGFANYFCQKGIKDSEKPWLLYKTWNLQPPEYSAYRFLNTIRQLCKNTDKALSDAFNGRIDIDCWEDIFSSSIDWKNIERKSEHITMAMALDMVPADRCYRELRPGYGGTDRFHHFYCCKSTKDDGRIPADFLLDLYDGNSLYPWVFVPGISEAIWGSWGMGTYHAKMGMDSNPAEGRLKWPHGPVYRTTKKEDWIKITKESPYEWAREAAKVWSAEDDIKQ